MDKTINPAVLGLFWLLAGAIMVVLGKTVPGNCFIVISNIWFAVNYMEVTQNKSL